MQKTCGYYFTVAVFTLALVIAGGITGYIIGGKQSAGRSVGEIADAALRYDQLDREYTERQREIESGIDQCLGYAEAARAIAERTGENSGRAVANLREAVGLIKQGIEERENLKMELDNLRAALHGLRALAGLEAE